MTGTRLSSIQGVYMVADQTESDLPPTRSTYTLGRQPEGFNWVRKEFPISRQILESRHTFSGFHAGYTSGHLLPVLITACDFNHESLS